MRPELPLSAHLGELRARIFLVLAPALVLLFIVYPFSGGLIETARLALLPDFRLVGFSVTEAFVVRLKVSLVVVMVAVSPWCLYQGAAFLAPGLHPEELRLLRRAVVVVSLGFAGGLAVVTLAALKPFLALLASQAVGGSGRFLSTDTFVALVCLAALAGGVVGATPALLLFFWQSPLLNVLGVRRMRRSVYSATISVLLLLTPPNHLLAVALLAAPWFFVLELSWRVLARLDRNRRLEETLP